MNKFQKVAYQLAKDDCKKELYQGQSVQKRSRITYSEWRSKRIHWSFEKCIDFKNWSKHKEW